jgi:hypothetical protein
MGRYLFFSAQQAEALSQTKQNESGKNSERLRDDYWRFGLSEGGIKPSLPLSDGLIVWSTADGRHAVTVTMVTKEPYDGDKFKDGICMGQAGKYLGVAAPNLTRARPLALPIDEANLFLGKNANAADLERAAEIAESLMAEISLGSSPSP